MKPRHAAAFALVVWWLIIPPTRGGPPEILYHAPVSKWFFAEDYNTKADCEDRLKEIAETTQDDLDQCSNGECAVTVGRFASGRCIASDDPRLKEKKSGKTAN